MPKLHFLHVKILIALISTSSALISSWLLSLLSIVKFSPTHWMNLKMKWSLTKQTLYAELVVSKPQPKTGSNVQAQPGLFSPLDTFDPLRLDPSAEQRFKVRRKKMMMKRTKIEEGMIAGEWWEFWELKLKEVTWDDESMMKQSTVRKERF